MQRNDVMTRREFLRLGILTIGSGFLFAACGKILGEDAFDEETDNYYLQNQDTIMKETRQTLGFVQQAAASQYGEEEAAQLADEALQRFETLLPDLPYIGGGQNDLTANLYQSAAALAFYQAMLEHGKTVEETGEILYRAVETQMASMPLMGMGGRAAMSDLAQKKFAQEAELSQERLYPEDWVFDFVEGGGEAFEYGIDYTECGICKYLKAQGASELTPYLCLLDFPMSQAMNTGLVRTTTLAQGGDRCDFRYKTGRTCQREWTPGFLDETE